MLELLYLQLFCMDDIIELLSSRNAIMCMKSGLSFPLIVSEERWAPAFPLIEWIGPLLLLIQRIAPFLCFSKKREKGCIFMMFVCIFNVPYTLNLKMPLEIKHVPLRISKVTFSYFQHPVLFWGWKEFCCRQHLFSILVTFIL